MNAPMLLLNDVIVAGLEVGDNASFVYTDEEAEGEFFSMVSQCYDFHRCVKIGADGGIV